MSASTGLWSITSTSGGKRFGPFSVNEIAAGLAKGDYSQSDHVWHEGLNQSKPLSEVFKPPTETLPSVRAVDTLGELDIPTKVMQTIRGFARREYPDDYTMQRHVIEEQCGAFSAINRFSTPGVPRNVFVAICERAATEYPDDYSMQQFAIEEQLEAYRHLYPD